MPIQVSHSSGVFGSQGLIPAVKQRSNRLTLLQTCMALAAQQQYQRRYREVRQCKWQYKAGHKA
jgi:hypothetical protein